jgi:hypothetical protein
MVGLVTASLSLSLLTLEQIMYLVSTIRTDEYTIVLPND